MAQTVQSLSPDGSSTAYFAPATVHLYGDTIYISGQGGAAPDGFVPCDYQSQIHLALVALRKILISASASVADILKLTLYVVNYDADTRLHAKPIQKFLGGHKPAITLVPVPRLAVNNWLFEVDAVVARPCSARTTRQIRSLSPPLAQQPTADVVIIGAGLSGLTAAEKITQAGLSCIVLEARDRVGGRTWSQTLSDGASVVELGAAWLNRTNQSKAHALAVRLGAEFIEQNTTGKCVLQDRTGKITHFAYGDTPQIDSTTSEHLTKIRDTVERDCQRLDRLLPRDSHLDSITFAEYLRSLEADPDAIATATVWTRAMLGQEPEDISALFFLQYCKSGGGLLQMRSDREHGGQFLRIRQGTQHLSNGLAAVLPAGTVRLSSPVTSVEQLGAHRTLVSGPTFSFTARKVISAVPPPVLSTLTFSPALPPSKTLLATSYHYGYYKKVLMSFRKPFWVSKGFCGLVQSFNGPISIIRDSSIPIDNKYLLTCFMAGSPAQKWSQQSPAERQNALLAHIGMLYGDAALAKDLFIELLESSWGEDTFTGYGCPSPSLPPGVLSTAVDAIREPVGDVHFIGTETAEEWRGYMDGAIRSGERGASEVVYDLQHPKARI